MLSNAHPKVRPGHLSRAEAKQAQRAQEATAMRLCYRRVDTRDEGRCRVCLRRGNPEATTLLDRLHRHHMVYRSRGGEHLPENVLSVCKACHDAIHVTATLRVSGDAEAVDAVTGKLAGVVVERVTDAGWTVEKWV